MSIPPYGLTLQAPWGALVAWGGKRIENRSKGVATSVGSYRGRVALTASKCHTVDGSAVSALPGDPPEIPLGRQLDPDPHVFKGAFSSMITNENPNPSVIGCQSSS